MATYLTDDEFLGKPTTPVASRVLSDEEFFGGDKLSASIKRDQSPLGILKAAATDIFGQPVPAAKGAREDAAQFNIDPQARRVVQRTSSAGEGLPGQTLGALAQIEDMLISTANIFSLPGTWATALLAKAKGETPKIQAQAALGYREQFLPEWLQAPFGKIAEAMGPTAKASYEDNPVGWLMQHFGESVEKGSKHIEESAGIPAEFLQVIAGQAMDLIGAKGVKAGVKDAAGRYETAAKDRVMGVQRALTPEMEVTVRPGEVGDLAAAEDAKIARQAAHEEALASAQKRVAEGKVFNLSETESKALMKEGKRLAREQKAQTGKADPDLLAALALGTAGAAVVYRKYKEWQASQDTPLEDKPIPEPNEYDIREPGKAHSYIADAALGAAAAMGAIKPRGGNWHPEASRKLAESFKTRQDVLEARERNPEIKDDNALPIPLFQWAQDRVTKYLNKHAGTATDPLKEVEVPFGEGTATWEHITDGLVKGKQAEDYGQNMLPGSKHGETIWKIERGMNPQQGLLPATIQPHLRAITSYLSHVGDYLREHVPAEKLQQYDLVRAVKETAAWDKELAKKMNDARIKDTADSPVYKDYGDGMKWVQLTRPGQFARESDVMGHSVKGYEPEGTGRRARYGPEGHAEDAVPAHPDWIPASGDSGHPSYGLGGWEAIKRGDAKIYSLRDAKGGSHVTVEVGDNFGGRPEQWISQIKGKQNRAPSSDYLSYVQDFVKGGKWGEVGDLHNTNLKETAGNLAGADARFRKYAEEKLGKYSTEGEVEALFKEWYKSSASNPERGSVDPRLLAAIAAAGGVAAYLAQHPEETENLAALGLVAATGKGKLPSFITATGKYAGAIIGELDRNLGRSTTRLGNISPALTTKVRDTALEISREASRASEKIEAFTTAVKDLPKEAQAKVNSAYLSHDPGTMANLIKGHPKAVAAYRELRNWIDATGDTLRGLGRFREGLTEHMPRVVKDYEGLMEALGEKAKVSIERILEKAESKSLLNNKRELTDVERSVIIDNWLRSDGGQSSLPGFARNRTVTMAPELEQFYHTMPDSLARYGHAVTTDIATARFFGKDLKTTKEGGKSYTNLQESIGALTNRLLEDKSITPKQAVEIQEILRAAFGQGQKAPAGFIQDVRNVTGIGLLGQIGSGLIQTSEAALSVYHHSIRPAIEAAGILLTGKGISPKEFGLSNHVIEEVIGKRVTGQALSGVLKLNMLALFDQLGMKQNLTASYVKNKRLASTTKGAETLRKEWGEAYGPDFSKLVQDLKTSSLTNRSRLVDSLVYQELSNTRPTSMMEMPQRFNEHPNLRFMWQLKQFMLSQADLVRRDAYNKIKSGNPREMAVGFKNLALYGTALSVVTIPATAVKDWIMGREIEIDPVANIGQNFGMSRYSMDKVMSSNTPGKAVLETAGGMVTPPAYSLGKTVAEGVSEPKKLVPLVPLLGRTYYNRELGGNELARIAKKKKEKREKLEASETTVQRANRKAREALRKQRRIDKERRAGQ